MRPDSNPQQNHTEDNQEQIQPIQKGKAESARVDRGAEQDDGSDHATVTLFGVFRVHDVLVTWPLTFRAWRNGLSMSSASSRASSGDCHRISILPPCSDL